MTPGDALIDAIADAVVERMKTMVAVKPRLLTADQAATYIGRTRNALGLLVARRAFPAVKADGRLMLDVQDLDRWIEQNKTLALGVAAPPLKKSRF